MHTLNLCHCGRVLRPGRINNNEPYSVIVVVPAVCVKALHVLNMQKQAQKPIDLPRSNGVCGNRITVSCLCSRTWCSYRVFAGF